MNRPKSAQSRNESDLRQKSLRLLQTATDPIERIRLACLARGSGGILGLGRVFRRMDDDGSKRLHFEEFKKGIDETLTELTDLTADEVKQLFDNFDKDNNGSVGYEEFLRAIRPPMNATREKLVQEAYKKLDKSGDGSVTLSDLKDVYSVKHHPQYISGELDEQQILHKFMSNFEGEGGNADGTVTKEEFLNYYSGVSASIDSDAYFDLMMRNCWKL